MDHHAQSPDFDDSMYIHSFTRMRTRTAERGIALVSPTFVISGLALRERRINGDWTLMLAAMMIICSTR
jgi:hypothetical protein